MKLQLAKSRRNAALEINMSSHLFDLLTYMATNLFVVRTFIEGIGQLF